METPQLIHTNTTLFDNALSFVEINRIFFSYFSLIPNKKVLYDLDGTKIRKCLAKDWSDKIVYTYSHKIWSYKKKEFLYEDLLYILDNRMALSVGSSCIVIFYDPILENESNEILMQFTKFRRKSRITQEISLVVTSVSGLDTVDIKIKKPKLDINTHYNKELSPTHNSTLSHLKSNEKSGLHLFYGPPGTGKSTYIRYLLRSIRKPVIFIPPGLASNLDSPDFTSFLIKNTNTVFVIEDAEELLVSRNGSRNASLSMILNLTDGLLGECFGIQIIATFNTDLINIDKALLRKGRLLTKYEFGKLSVEKSRSLLHSLGHYKYMVEQPMTLAEIFNIQEVGYEIKSERTPIGFLANAS